MNKHKFQNLFLILCLPFVFGFGEVNQDAVDVSLINLIATPNKFHGKIVRVIGVSNIEFESNVIYLTKKHLVNGATKNALWISLDFHAIGKTENELSKYNGQYVLVEGVFDKESYGHMGLMSGTIRKIKRFMPWPPPIPKSKK